MKKQIVLAVTLLLATTFALTSCSTTSYNAGESKKDVKAKVENGEWGGPKNSTLLFGNGLSDISVLQQNPQFGYKTYSAQAQTKSTTIQVLIFPITLKESVFFIQPLPVGTELKVYSRMVMDYNTKNTYYSGIAGVDFKYTKPGLFYYNTADKDNKNELKALKKLLPYFEGTSWESAINSRIQEIENAKK